MRSLRATVCLAWLAFWSAVATLVLAIPIIAAGLLGRTGNLAFSLTKIWAYIMLAVSFVRTEILNREKIAPGTSYIIMSNHQSLYDILALVTTLGIQYRWFIKKEVLKVPLFGYGLYASRNIFIDRSNTARAIESINRGIDRLPAGVSILVFPEGTRSADGQIHPFKKGGFIPAVERKIPVLPVTVNGSRRVLPKGSLALRPGKIQVVIGDPIETSACTHADVPDLIDRTRQAVLANFHPEYPARS
ncbi:MAG: 1-acyl-sn-glycerol-3-phosphate acyltransferase [Syntrophaceae bacterium]|nr:1-acyl-sn-glycerol-3-phosphate acyltransferase [Syntrophaceae bacterium]